MPGFSVILCGSGFPGLVITERTMIDLPAADHSACDGLSRREWLCAGGLSTVGMMLPDLLRARDKSSAPSQHFAGFGRAKSCIALFLFGAPAHQDMWDMKPDAPKEIRGEFNPVASKVPGIL